MVSNFKVYQLGQLGRIVTGKTPPTSRDELFGDEYPFITPVDMHDVKNANSTERSLSEAGAQYQYRLIIPRGSIAVSCIGWQMGKSIIITRPSFTNQQLNTIIPHDWVNSDFLYYTLVTLRQKIFSIGSGVGVRTPILNKSAFSVFEVSLPSFDFQCRIGATLSAYDDLIENNARRIAILEEMAQQIYEEWFINYRFPGHEAVPLVESELGLVPEDWGVVSAADTIEVNPKVKVPKDGEKPFVPMGCLSEVNMLISNIEARAGNSGAKFQNGDTLFARITPCLENGKTAYVQFLSSPASVAFGSTEFIVLRSRKLTPEFVYLLARSDGFRNNAIKSMAGADGRQRVKEACFASYMLALPDEKTLEKFHGMVHPMFDMIHVLACKNENLRQTRDLLLPRLISGELDISTLPVPEDMAA